MATQEAAQESAAQSTSAQQQTPETRTPEAWARELFPTASRGRLHPELWQHGAADALHGWKLEEHHAGKPLQLTRTDYEAALKAASQPKPVPHGPALSRHLPQSKGH